MVTEPQQPAPSPDGRTERARRQRLERRSQILTAALSVFAERGYHGTGVADIIRAARVARGTFYLYFASKRALFDQVLDDLLDEVDQGVKRVELGPAAPPPLDQLEANFTWLLSLTQARPQMLRILLWEAVGLDAELDRKLDSFHQKMFALTQRSLETGVAMGLVRECDTALMARCVVGCLKEIMLSLLVRGDLECSDPAPLARGLLEFGARGLLRWEGEDS